MGAVHHGELGVAKNRGKVRCGGAAARAVDRRGLVEAHPVLFAAVEVVVVRKARFLRGLEECQAQGVPIPRVANVQGSVGAMHLAGEAHVVLGPLEHGKHILPGPAGAARVSPSVVVGRRAADVHHGVD